MEIEERAKLMGWVPKDDFKGDPERWTSAEAFVERADNIMPIMKSQMGKYEEQLKSTGDELKTTKSELASLKKTMEKVISANKKVGETAYNQALETIRKEQRKAIDNNDGEAWEKLEADKAKLEESKPEPLEFENSEQTQEPPPEFQKWVADNQWYHDDTELRKFADLLAKDYVQANPNATNEQMYGAVESEIKKTFAHKFKNPNRNENSAVAGGSPQGSETPSGKKNYSSLPKEAKAACDALCNDLGGTKEEKDAIRKQWIADYFEGE